MNNWQAANYETWQVGSTVGEYSGGFAQGFLQEIQVQAAQHQQAGAGQAFLLQCVLQLHQFRWRGILEQVGKGGAQGFRFFTTLEAADDGFEGFLLLVRPALLQRHRGPPVDIALT
jgi:hypothetical protein